MNELAHSKSCVEQVNKYCVQYVSGNGLHPVTWLKLPIRKGYHIFLNLYWPNKLICIIEALPPWVVPIFCLAHGLNVVGSIGTQDLAPLDSRLVEKQR